MSPQITHLTPPRLHLHKRSLSQLSRRTTDSEIQRSPHSPLPLRTPNRNPRRPPPINYKSRPSVTSIRHQPKFNVDCEDEDEFLSRTSSLDIVSGEGASGQEVNPHYHNRYFYIHHRRDWSWEDCFEHELDLTKPSSHISDIETDSESDFRPSSLVFGPLYIPRTPSPGHVSSSKFLNHGFTSSAPPSTRKPRLLPRTLSLPILPTKLGFGSFLTSPTNSSSSSSGETANTSANSKEEKRQRKRLQKDQQQERKKHRKTMSISRIKSELRKYLGRAVSGLRPREPFLSPWCGH